MTAELLKLAYLSAACGAVSLLVAKAAILNFFHEWLEKHSPFLEEMLSCPWCTSHWVALGLTVTYKPLLFAAGGWLLPLDYLVTIEVMVTLASVAARIIYSAYKPIMG
jgi:hypothetical protein